MPESSILVPLVIRVLCICAVVLGMSCGLARADDGSLPDAPTGGAHRVPSTSFWVMVGSTAALTAADGFTSAHCEYERWNPWLYGRRLEPPRIALVEFGILAVSSLASYWLRRRHTKFWSAPLGAAGVSAGLGSIHNVHSCF